MMQGFFHLPREKSVPTRYKILYLVGTNFLYLRYKILYLVGTNFVPKVQNFVPTRDKILSLVGPKFCPY